VVVPAAKLLVCRSAATDVTERKAAARHARP